MLRVAGLTELFCGVLTGGEKRYSSQNVYAGRSAGVGRVMRELLVCGLVEVNQLRLFAGSLIDERRDQLGRVRARKVAVLEWSRLI